LGTLFSGASADPSIQHRTNDYPIVFYYFNQRPWLGRGPGTFIPAVYGGRVLDNQWLGQLVGTGLVGVAALAALHIAGIVLAAVAWRRSTRAEDRHLCACLVSTMLIGLVVAATFDSMGFTTYSTTLALLMGMCGAVWRFTHPARQVRTASVRRV
jgi:O-antigen ligase